MVGGWAVTYAKLIDFWPSLDSAVLPFLLDSSASHR
jgi:hypothetical protein